MNSAISRVMLDLMTGMLGNLSVWVKEDPSRASLPLPGNARGLTPLHVAVQNGHHNLASWLISNGADPNGMSADPENPQPPLMMAVGMHKPNMVRMLVRAGADPWATRAAWFASYSGDIDFLAALQQEPKADFRNFIWPASPPAPSTDLVLAAIQGEKWETVEWLVERGIGPHRSPTAWPPGGEACWRGIEARHHSRHLEEALPVLEKSLKARL